VSTSRGFADDGYQLDHTHGNPVGNGISSSRDRDLLDDGSIVIAAITSCTNTSNPTVMVGAGLLARKANEAGLRVRKYVKCSLAPGSTVVTDYLTKSNLLEHLEALGFNLVGYGCTTCIGNSGPLPSEVEEEIRHRELYSVAVLSGNRNFDGRIHPMVKAAFLMSPMLVVAYALAGRIGFDFHNEPLGRARDGSRIFLRDIWPTMTEIREAITKSVSPQLYRDRYANATAGDEKWRSLTSASGDVYAWDEKSTYIRNPPWFTKVEGKPDAELRNARVLAIFEDKVTTDHISPAGAIPEDSPAGTYLLKNGVSKAQFSTYGSRRGNHEVMVRGGFSNIRLRNILAKGKEGGWTTHFPSGELLTIFDAATRYQNEGVPLIVLAGKQYGAGSSRDWAAKAPNLLKVRAVIAESFERIHRSNLAAMGILPLEFQDGQNWKTLGLEGDELFTIEGTGTMTKPKSVLEVRAKSDRKDVCFKVACRLENEVEIRYYRQGGVLPYVFSRLKSPGPT